MQKKQKNIINIAILGLLALSAYTVVAAETEKASDRPVPTVADCVEKTGKTESECQDMMEKFKNMPKPEKGNNMRKQPEGNVSKTEGSQARMMKEETNVSVVLERVKRMKAQREEQFNRIGDRIEKIIEFLNSNEVNTESLEIDLETFKTKEDDVSTAYASYIASLENDISLGKETLSDESKEKKSIFQEALKNIFDFYRSTLRENIKNQLEKVN